MTATVDISGVSKHYGRVIAVNGVAICLNRGEIIALVGHNGAGKTTLIKLMLGLIRPTTGTVRVLGEDPARGNFAVRQRLGYLPESVSFHMALTGWETLAFYARMKRVDMASIDPLFERVGLAPEAANRPVRTYSKGMRQRLGLAQALLGEPRILLLDEPTSGLDPALRRHFYNLIKDLREGGTTVLLSSHALTELEDRADRVVIINRGIKIADGTLDDLRHLAQLPTRISVTLPGDTAPNTANPWTRGPAGIWEIDVTPQNKIGTLRTLTADPTRLTGLTIAEPTLDDLYAHFLNAQAPQ